MNIPQVFKERASGPKIALIYYGRQFSYEELGRFARLFAQVFMNLGVKKGDRVALMMSNVPQFVFAYYGAILLGAIVTPVNLLTMPRSYSVRDRNIHVPCEIRAQIQDAAPSVIMAFDFYFPLLQELQEEIERLNAKVILTGPHEFMPAVLKHLAPIKLRQEGRWIKIDRRPPWLFDFNTLLKQENDNAKDFPFFPGMNAEENGIAHLQYTTGTTGIPKGVMLSHKNLLANASQANLQLESFLSHGEEVILGILPFFHMYGLTVAMQITLLMQEGALLLVADPHDIKRWVFWIRDHKVTVIPSVPRFYERVLETKGLVTKEVFRSVKVYINGAGALPTKTRKLFEELSGAKILEGYGLSEASPVVSVCTRDSFREGSIGKPIPGTEVRIVDVETGEDFAVRQEGEIVVRGPQVMQGYWNKPEETARALRGGWLYTGDIGYMDEDGFLYLTDRISDMVKISGEWVSPSEVEKVLRGHPNVQDVAVLGVTKEDQGEQLVACVVLEDTAVDASAFRKELSDYARNILAPFKIPRDVRYLTPALFDSFKNPLGKVLRRKIKDAIKNDEL